MIPTCPRPGNHVALPGVASDAGGGQRGFVINEHAFPERGFFYSHWEHGGNEWQRVRVTALECPRIGRDSLDEERRAQKGDFEMEYMCEFMEDGLSVFNRDLVEKALGSSVLPLVAPEIGNW